MIKELEYSTKFESLFSPHPEIMNIVYFPNFSVLSPISVEKSQKSELKPEKTEIKTEITPVIEESAATKDTESENKPEPKNNYPAVMEEKEIKDITPKKHFWRK